MVKDEEAIKEAFNKFITQQAREQECHNDEVRDVILNIFLNYNKRIILITNSSTGRLE